MASSAKIDLIVELIHNIEVNLEQVRKMAKEALLRGSDLVEFRLDLIWENPPELRQINELLKGFSNKAILTWRTTSHGGHGSHPTNLWIERLSFLARYVDIEYDIATKGLKCGGKRIVSWHDPHGTPEEKVARHWFLGQFSPRIQERYELPPSFLQPWVVEGILAGPIDERLLSVNAKLSKCHPSVFKIPWPRIAATPVEVLDHRVE